MRTVVRTVSKAEIQAAPSNLVLNAFTTQPVCFGDLGSVLLSPTGGVGLHAWIGSGKRSWPGSYQYTVTDANVVLRLQQPVINPARIRSCSLPRP